MKLKHRKELKIVVDYWDLEELIKEVYNQEDYEFTADMECGNDTKKSFKVKKGEFEGSLGEYYRKDIQKFIDKGEYSYLAGKLLNDLADKDIIQEGDYLINVSW